MEAPYRQAVSTSVDLGPRVSRHAKKDTLGGRIAGSLFFFGPAVFIGGRAFANGVPLFDPAAPLVVNAAWFLLLVVLPLLGVGTIVQAVRHRHDVVTLHERGVLAHVSGADTRIAFDDIRSIKSRVVQTRGGIVHAHEVRYVDGVLSLNGDYERIDALMEGLRRGTIEQLVTRAREQLAAGTAVTFGPFTLDREALGFTGKRLLRSALDAVDVRMGVVYVYAKGQETPWAERDVADVANAHVLLALANEPR